MHFLRTLLLVAIATITGCGGGGSDNPWTAAPTEKGAGSATSPSDAFTLSSSSVTFTGTQGGADPAHQYVWIYRQSPASFDYVTISQRGTMFDQTYDFNTWYSPPVEVIDIRPGAPVEAGVFRGSIIVNACYSAGGPPCNQAFGTPKTIQVTYNVAGLSVTPRQLTFSSTGSNPAMQTATLAVTGVASTYATQISYSPSATDWLQVKPRSGTPNLALGQQTLTFNVNAAGLPAGVHGAAVTFTSPPSFSVSMTVTLFVGDPRVNFVAPYVVSAGAGGNVIIRGRGFSALSPEGLSVQFNSASAMTAIVVSDTEIRATYPPLAAGKYSISVSSGATLIPSRAALKLVVIDPPAFPLHTIQRPASAGPAKNLIYDAERQALLFVDPTNNRILRYALADGDSGSTSLDVAASGLAGSVGQLALSPDGTELIRAPTWGPLTRLDPVTLAVLSSVDSVQTLGNDDRFMALAFANDGGLISGLSLQRYDMLTQAVTAVSSYPQLGQVSQRPMYASADGGTLVLPNPGPTSSDSRVYTYDASTGALTARPVTTSYFRGLSISRDGSRILLSDMDNAMPMQTTIYDAQFNALGTLPDHLGGLISPDGNFAYMYSMAEGRVRKFDLRVPQRVTEVGTGSVVAPANTQMSAMTISPDGGTLFLVGTTSVVIAPAP